MSRFLLAAVVLIAAAPAALAETPKASAGGVRVTTDESTGVTITTVQPWEVITGRSVILPFAAPPQAAAPAMPSAPVGGGSAAYGAATSFGYGAGVASTTQDGVTGATPLGTADLDANGIANDKVVGLNNRDMAFGPRGYPGAATATVVPKR